MTDPHLQKVFDNQYVNTLSLNADFHELDNLLPVIERIKAIDLLILEEGL
jgi:hypothetical protein